MKLYKAHKLKCAFANAAGVLLLGAEITSAYIFVDALMEGPHLSTALKGIAGVYICRAAIECRLPSNIAQAARLVALFRKLLPA